MRERYSNYVDENKTKEFKYFFSFNFNVMLGKMTLNLCCSHTTKKLVWYYLRRDNCTLFS